MSAVALITATGARYRAARRDAQDQEYAELDGEDAVGGAAQEVEPVAGVGGCRQRVRLDEFAVRDDREVLRVRFAELVASHLPTIFHKRNKKYKITTTTEISTVYGSSPEGNNVRQRET